MLTVYFCSVSLKAQGLEHRLGNQNQATNTTESSLAITSIKSEPVIYKNEIKYSFPTKCPDLFFPPECISLIILTESDPHETKLLSILTEVKRFCENSLLKLLGTLNPFKKHKNAV